jgi:hypothetical protein
VAGDGKHTQDVWETLIEGKGDRGRSSDYKFIAMQTTFC